MIEKFNPEEYRDNLAESLVTKRGLGEDGIELAKEQLDLEKDTVEYNRAKIQHKEDNLIKKREIEKAESIESSKLEWGPDLGTMSWRQAKVEIKKLNKGLKWGEKKWRLPEKDELVAVFEKKRSALADFNDRFTSEYWSGNTEYNAATGSRDAYTVNMHNGDVSDYNKENDMHVSVRLVR